MSEAAAKPTDVKVGFTWGSLRDRISGGNKAVRFALWGAMGCLGGAILGEFLLAATRTEVPAKPARAVCLLVDCSESMRDGDERGTKLDEVKAAASQFVERQDLSRDLIGVVGFATSTNAVAKPGDESGHVRSAIARLNFAGGTAIHRGLEAAAEQLASIKDTQPPISKYILLFTDGQPDNASRALMSAARCRESQIKIVAIGTGDADDGFLAELTGDPKSVFSAQSGTFGDTFQQAEKVIYGGSLVESSPTQGSFLKALLQIIGWSGLLAAGGSLALIAGQNLYLHRPAFSKNEILVGTLGGLVAGIVAGAAGQLFFALTVGGSEPSSGSAAFALLMSALGRIVGWALLGGLIGRGLAFFVPNLQPRFALAGGALGGVVAAIAFLFISSVGDVPGRLLGGAILGACIGLMIVAVEAAFREYWLEVRFGTRETVKVTLGPSPVKIGSNSQACAIYARGARPLEVGYLLVNDVVQCVDYSTEKTTQAKPGDERVVGNLTVVVRDAAGKSEGKPLSNAMAGGPARSMAPPVKLASKPPVVVNPSSPKTNLETRGKTKVPPPPAPPKKRDG